MNPFQLFRHKKISSNFFPKSLSFFLLLLFLFTSFIPQTSFAQVRINQNTELNKENFNRAKQLYTACLNIKSDFSGGVCKNYSDYLARYRAANPESGDTATELKKQAEAAAEEGKTIAVAQDGKVNKIDKPVGICGAEGITVASCLTTLANFIVGGLLRIINSLLETVLSIVGWVLNIIVYTTVVQFRTNFSDLNLNVGPVSVGGIVGVAGSGENNLIYYLWGILRDMLNIILLIILIYAAVRTMFDGFETQSKKFIYLLLFSIVMNFSLLLVKVAIDVSNILSLQAYTLIAKPVGFATWKDFSTRAGTDNKPSDIGEFITNSFNLAQVDKVSTGASGANELISEGVKKTWMYQAGKLIVLIGLIYLLLYIAGMLLVRAAAFVLAMILASFLAADLFFQMAGKYQGDEKSTGGDEIAASVRKITNNMRNDFFDALVKGPVLFLFLFLLGVLSNAIFTQSMSAEIASAASSSSELKWFSKPFVESIAVFLKFALFFALAKAFFDELNALKIGEYGDGKWFGAASKSIANFGMRNTVGRLAGAAGWAGRNTIGRGLTAWNDGRIKKLEANTKKYDDKIKNGGVLSRNWAKGMQTWNDRSLRKVSERNEKGAFTSGSYDSRGVLKGDGRIAQGIKALGLTGDELGDATTKGFAAEKKRKDDEKIKRDKERQARVDKVEEDNFDENSDEFKNKVKEIKVDFAGDKYSQAEIEDAIKAHEKEPASNAISIGAKKNIISASDREKYFKGKDGKLSDADSAKYAIGSEKERIKTKIIADKQKARAQQERIQLAQQIDTKEGAKARRELGATYADKTEKDKKKRAAQIQTIRDINDGLKQVKSELEKAGEVEGKENLYKDNIEKIRVAIEELNVPQDKNFSNLSPKELSDLIDNFKGNESLQDQIILAKYGAASVLADHFQMYKQLNEDRKSKVSKLSVLEERLAGPVDSTGKVIKSGQDRAKTRLQISELKDEISSIDDILKTGRQRADNVSAKAKSTEERVIANFREAKPEEKKP